MSLKGVTVIFFIMIFLYAISFGKEQGLTQDHLNSIMTNASTNVFNITTNIIPYKNPYNSSMELVDYMFNIVHPLLYGTLVESFTFTGAGINLFWDKLNPQFFITVKNIFLVSLFIWLLSKLFTPVLATYMLISDFSDEKDWNLKWYIKLLITFLIWFFLIILIIWMAI